MDALPERELCCSFCGSSKHVVRKLILVEFTTRCICDACIASCANLLAKCGIAPFATVTEELAAYADEQSVSYGEQMRARYERDRAAAPVVDDVRSVL